MNSLSDSRFIYMLAVLPVLLGVTLVGDGISKLVHEYSISKLVHEKRGWVSIATGVTLLIIAGLIMVTGNPPIGEANK